MSFWTAMVIIAAIIGFVELQKSRNASRTARSETGPAALPDDSEMRRELTDLRERIKVLEQITVEGREARAIAEEIERLRDR
ncbi:hypothetical protein U4960_04960 [Altererythrobacter sp. H2]|uniref:hypothetical protein n=1 Tax=Altererythrobacter sp. H2 TaxID=3108391 RepID=UPI000BC9D87B|nr:hypothetical protein [Altererythrobacter sp. H2]OZA94811.1 MAG: hypothetical protein B7X57_00105 [Erythrobacter sp. 34-65-8]WRK96675.1 hypothetical protein U4960_04960 [Altererythrobacter sp. H2]